LQIVTSLVAYICKTGSASHRTSHYYFSFYAPQPVPPGTAEVRISYGNSVCPSVCLSVTTRWYTKPRWHRDSGSSPYGSLEYL